MMKIKKISDIFTKPEDFKTSWDEHEFTKKIFDNYKNKVVAYKITEKFCFILLEGKIKLFLLKFNPETNIYGRINKKVYETLLGKSLVITSKKGFEKFIKKEVLGKLK